MKALVFGKIYPRKVEAVLDEYKEGEPLLGRLVQMTSGDKLVIGRVVNTYRTANVIAEYNQAKDIAQSKDKPPVQAILKETDATVLDIELITALQGNVRVNLDFPIMPATEVHFLEDFPIQPIPCTGYLGYFKSTSIMAPLVLQDFQKLKEAYHFFVAGQTGSGKSTFVQMLLALYNKLNPNMNFLILDTMGEFTASFTGERDLFFHLKDVWQGDVEIYTPPDNIALEGWDLFRDCLLYTSPSPRD